MSSSVSWWRGLSRGDLATVSSGGMASEFVSGGFRSMMIVGIDRLRNVSAERVGLSRKVEFKAREVWVW